MSISGAVTARGDVEDGAKRKKSYIPEIDGIRGLALTLVVLFHLFGQGRVSGGVDVFLFVSGYLLTATLVRRVQSPSGFSLAAQFRNMFMKLAPPALVVLLATMTLTVLVSPRSDWIQVGREVVAAATYMLNWEMIDSRLAYGAAGPQTSPLQHFWSLSVQGQFFVLWPLIVVATHWISRRLRWRLEGLTGAILALMTVGSFVAALFLTHADQPVAYFSTVTRWWELALGGIIALVVGRLSMAGKLASGLSWLGVAMILVCGFIIDGGRLFPGLATLWPIAGIALVIVAANVHPEVGGGVLLRSRILKFFAGISYELYLWHWPILIFYLQYRDQASVGPRGAIGVLLLSVALAWLTKKLLSAPLIAIRLNVRPSRALISLAAASLAVILLAGGGVRVLEAERDADLAAASELSPDHPGARALLDGADTSDIDPAVEYRPSLEAAERDLPSDLYERGCVQSWRSEPGMDEVLVCEDLEAERPRRTIVMSGGSHVLHWYPALRALADAENWEIVVIDKDGCRLTLEDPVDKVGATCLRWNEEALRVIIGRAPDAVFTVGTRTPEVEGETERASVGQIAAWQRLAEAGIPVIAVRDSPRFLHDVPECLEKYDGDLARCGRHRGDIFQAENPLKAMGGLPSSTAALDLTDGFCGPQICAPVVGNVVAYRDQDHMTATYARTLDIHLRQAMEDSVPWLFR